MNPKYAIVMIQASWQKLPKENVAEVEEESGPGIRSTQLL